MTCADCNAARAQLWHGRYRIGCAGCAARSIARSRVMHEVARHRTPDAIDELRETCARMLPTLTLEQARAMVMEWWRHDRQDGTR